MGNFVVDPVYQTPDAARCQAGSCGPPLRVRLPSPAAVVSAPPTVATPAGAAARSSRALSLAWAALAVIVLARLATLGSGVLFDTTEARYAEVGRWALVHGEWVVPRIDADTAFLAKPPLYAWGAAAGMALAGVDAFGARLASWVFSLVTLALVVAMAGAASGRERIAVPVAGLVYVTLPLGWVVAGAVMTEASLVAATTAMMVAFWRAWTAPPGASAGWRWAFFAAAGIGMLAKGPVAIVYAALPIGAFCVLARDWRRVWACLPWLRGSLLAAAVCAPWYAAAEWRSPGFLEYFLVGEHLQRFLQPGWTGDRFGNAHAEPRGTIWLFWLAAVAWWAAVAVVLVALRWRDVRRAGAGGAGAATSGLDPALRRYLVAWAVAPMVFFSLSGNIIWTYVAPGLPAFAVLVAASATGGVRARLALGSAALAGLGLVAATVLLLPAYARERSAADTIAAWQAEQQRCGPGPVRFEAAAVPFSARFYSGARAAALGPAGLGAVGPSDAGWIVLRAAPGRDLQAAAQAAGLAWPPVHRTTRYALLRGPAQRCP